MRRIEEREQQRRRDEAEDSGAGVMDLAWVREEARANRHHTQPQHQSPPVPPFAPISVPTPTPDLQRQPPQQQPPQQQPPQQQPPPQPQSQPPQQQPPQQQPPQQQPPQQQPPQLQPPQPQPLLLQPLLLQPPQQHPKAAGAPGVGGPSWPGSTALSAEQHEAASQTPHHPLVIFAPAGSGKTTTLVHRVLCLHFYGQLRADQLLCLTFTRKAADELRSRLRSSMYGEVEVGTFHSWCLRLLRSYGQHIGQPADFRLSSTSQQLGLLQEAILAFQATGNGGDAAARTVPIVGGGGRGGGGGGRGGAGHSRGGGKENPLNALSRKLQQALLEAKTEGSRSGRGGGGGLLSTELGRFVCGHYAAALRRCGLVDMADLQGYALRLLGIPAVLAALRARYGHVLIDEFQDTSLQQLEIVRRLRGDAAADGSDAAAGTTGVTVVGDDDQAIYSWRGAEPRVFGLFASHLRGGSTSILTQNFRSSGAVVRASAAVICANEARVLKETWTAQPDGARVVVCECRNEACEHDWLVGQIGQLARQGVAPNKIAVLYRTHAIGRHVFQTLREHRVACAASPSDVLARPDVRPILQVLRLLTNSADDAAFRAVGAAADPALPAQLVEDLTAQAATRQLSLLEAARAMHAHGTVLGGSSAASAGGGAAGSWPELAPAAREALHKMLRVLDELSSAARRLTAAQLLQEVLRSRLIAAIKPERPPLGAKLLADEMSQAMNDCENEVHYQLSLERIAASPMHRGGGGGTPARPGSALSVGTPAASPRGASPGPLLPMATPQRPQKLQALSNFLQHHAFCEHEEGGRRRDEDGVTLTTVHGAKGREWEAVFVVRVNEDVMPLSLLDFEEEGENQDKLREERRLLYVAMTRARSRLFLSYTMLGPDNTPTEASRFLRPLPPEVVERTTHFELQHASHAGTGGAGFARPDPRTPAGRATPGSWSQQQAGTPLRTLSSNMTTPDGGGASQGRIGNAVSHWRNVQDAQAKKTPKPKATGAAKAKSSKPASGRARSAGDGDGKADSAAPKAKRPRPSAESATPTPKITPQRRRVVVDNDSDDDFT